MKYHINPDTGRAGQCSATVRGCKFSVGDLIPEHYDTKEDAKKAYEKKMKSKTTGTLKKKEKVSAADELIKANAAFEEALKKFSEYEYDEKGNTRYKGVDVVSEVVRFEGTDYVRLDADKNIFAGEPYSFRIQVGKERSEAEAEHLAQLVGYRYASTGGERGNAFVQDSPNSIIYYADTTKGRAYRRIDEFIDDLPNVVKDGSPVRKTDKSGPGTAGTRLVDGMGDLNYLEIYADHTYDAN